MPLAGEHGAAKARNGVLGMLQPLDEPHGIDAEGADDAGIEALEIEHQHVAIEAGFGVHHIATGARQPAVGRQIRRHVAATMQPWQVEVGKRRHRAPYPVQLKAGEGGTLDGKGDEVAIVEDLPHQLAIFQVVAGQRLLVGVEQLGDLLAPVGHILDILAAAKQLARHRIQAVAGKLPGGAFQGVDAIQHHAPGDNNVASLGVVAR